MCQMWLQHFSTLRLMSQKGPFMFRHPPETQYPEPTVWRLKRQLYGLKDSPRSWQIHLNQVLKSLNLSQMKSDPCTFTGLDSSDQLNLIVMAYVDDLVIAGEDHSVQKFVKDIQETFSLKHVEYLTPDHPIEFLGRIIKVKRSGQITMEFPQKLIDNLLDLSKVKARSTTNGVKMQTISKEDQVKSDKDMHSKFRTAIGKLLWMSQLRDDIKFPVKELSRSLTNPQASDFDNLIHLLKYVNQTRDFVYVMDPQIPTADSQGFIPVEVVNYSDSDWAGCQRSRRSTSGSLITLFSVNISSTTRTQASVSHSSAEADLYAMTQAAVESLAIKHFIKELKSAILSRDVKITLKTDSSAGKTMASRLGISRKSKHIELRHLWIQDVLSEGIMSLEKVGTHHNPSDVLTKFVQASVLGQHLPKLNLFKDHSLSLVTGVQVLLRCREGQDSRQEIMNHAAVKEACCSDQRLASLYQQVCGQHQGQVCMINFEAIQDQQDFVIQRFRSASIRIRRAFTPPPRRGSDHSDHSDSEEDIQVRMPIQMPDVGQDVRNVVLSQNASPTRSWWSFLASIMSLMHFIVQCYQFVNGMVMKAKQIIVVYVNVNQVRQSSEQS